VCKKKLRLAPETFELSGWLQSAATKLRADIDQLCSRAKRLWRVLLGQLTRKVTRPRHGREQLNLIDAELDAVMEHTLEHPGMGGKKRAANLTHLERVWLGARACDDIKHELARLAGQAIASRRAPRKPPAFELEKPTGPDQAWSSDFVTVKIWGKSFDVCAHQDLFTQEKLSLDAVEGSADSIFLRDCFEQACEARAGTFQGAAVQYEVLLGGGQPVRVNTATPKGQRLFPPGAEVAVCFDPADVILIPQEDQ
jgi:transposase InsO family protein